MLEHRYRALLRCYPADYREEYGEEIITVLLGTARPGQRRPGFRGALDLLKGGLTVRLRRAFALLLIPGAPLILPFVPVRISGPVEMSAALFGLVLLLFTSAVWANRALERRFAAGR